MKAIVQNACGSAEVLKLVEIDKPVIKENDVLVCVQATAINAGDYFPLCEVFFTSQINPKGEEHLRQQQ